MKHRKPVDPASLPYRPCVGMMVLNRRGLVWMGKRIVEEGSEIADNSQLWQMPQGGIDPDEEPLVAARRELYEETGMRRLSVLAEAPRWIDYDLPPHLVGIAFKGRYRGQRQKWYAFRFEGDDGEIAINPPPGGHEAEFDEWAWREMRELPEIVVPFKRGVYQELVAIFGHLAA
ncbi:MAG: RNA pyrophosphohydrolase [Rhizobiaceae bacterium]